MLEPGSLKIRTDPTVPLTRPGPDGTELEVLAISRRGVLHVHPERWPRLKAAIDHYRATCRFEDPGVILRRRGRGCQMRVVTIEV